MFLRFVLFIAFLPSLHSRVSARTDTGYAKVLILGLIHTGNEQFGYRDLAAELERLDPDLVLWEQSTAFKRVFGLRIASFLRIWRPGIEQLALQKFTARRKDIEILPFDIEIPDRMEYIRKLKGNRAKVFDTLWVARKTSADSLAFFQFAEQYNRHYEGLEKMTMVEINAAETVDRTRALRRLEESLIGDQVERYVADTTLLEWFRDEQAFWIIRNNFMVGRIEQTALDHPGKTIVVLTGIDHKYFLEDGLRERAGVRLIPYLAGTE